jgi:uncharacterized protein YceK
MRKLALSMVVVVAALVLVGCGTSVTYVNPYEAAEMGERAQTVLDENMDPFAEEYMAMADTADDPEYYLDVSDAEPVFVGYEMVAFEEEPDDAGNTEFVSLFYVNGATTVSPETLDPVAEPPSVSTLHIDDMRTGPEDPDADEEAALLAAADTLEEQFSAEDLEGVVLGIKRYVFLYDTGEGSAVLLGQTLDGETGYWSDPVQFEQE